MKNVYILLFVIFVLSGCAAVQQTDSGPDLSIKWEMFPNPKKEIVNPGEEIIFKLTPKVTSALSKKITMYFGDGSMEEKQMICDPRSSGSWLTCKPVYFSHKYGEDNIYEPYIQTDCCTYPTASKKEKTQFIIAPRVLTDEEFKDLAFEDSINQLKMGITKILGKRKPSDIKFALTSFKNANFEYAKSEDDQRDIAIMKKMTTALVNDGYNILEKNPQALIRLAHESIVKKDSSGKASDQYEDSLEYGLRTEYNDPSRPFVYGAQIEGVKSSDKEYLSKKKGSSDGFFGQKSSKMTKASASKVQNSESDKHASEAYVSNQERALYFARFSTADYVITIDRKNDNKDDIYLRKSKPVYYDIKFETKMIERTAQTKYAARILERNGNIVWVEDITGLAQDRVIPDFVKTSDGKKQTASFGSLFGSILGK